MACLPGYTGTMSLQIVGTPVRKYPNNVTLPGELDAAGQAEKLPAVRAWKVQ
jgi:hypothetical protein